MRISFGYFFLMFLFISNVNDYCIVLYYLGYSSSSLVYDLGEIILIYDNGYFCY